MEPNRHDDVIREHLRRIEQVLADIRHNTQSAWYHALLYSALRGAGFLIGTVLAITIAGWILSYLGIIPGLGDIARHLRDALEARIGR